ncbi:SHC SH2 domain-binding protein 1 [Sphaerodactylus townsendi]|uniref:SHC SH2 domain-binding protein 1 n=1 Tax=Sphaerodactylus townsendi TaxID=933632 RepID=A0ACB8EAU2_9SAUR|nr:SHC SH2 domain-binding protein 1 [Sphaerodactylus townsendi]
METETGSGAQLWGEDEAVEALAAPPEERGEGEGRPEEDLETAMEVEEEEKKEEGEKGGNGEEGETPQPALDLGDSEHQEDADVLRLDTGDESADSGGGGSCSSDGDGDKPGTALQRLGSEGDVPFPDTFQTNNLLFYERFKAYQDYMLADCKASEVKEFTAEYLEKVLEPFGWQAIWRTDVFEVLVEVVDVEYSTLKAVVRLSDPFLCEPQGATFTLGFMQELLALKGNQLLLQELWVAFDESGEFDQTALAIEHVRFFYKHVWRSWDEEDDDDFDYFVRCVEPRLRLYYDILENRVSSALVADYHNLLSQCEELYRKFLNIRNSLSGSDSDSEAENVSVVEGVKLYDRIEHLKQKLKLIENPLLRYVFGYQKHARLQAKGIRPAGTTITHVVSATVTSNILACLLRDKLSPASCNEEIEIQFHSDPLSAMNACYEGDRIIICPGHYSVEGALYVADSIELEGYGFPDDVVIEKRGKGDAFVECAGADVKISNLKLIQHDAIEGILSVHQGKTKLENCVLQCETTGVAVRKSAELFMKNSDLYGAKGAGVEIYPGSTCTLMGNGIHHCKEGILIKDFLDEHYEVPKITLVSNVIHNNEGYGVVLVKPAISCDATEATLASLEGKITDIPSSGEVLCTVGEEVPERASGELDPYGRMDAAKHTEGNSEITNELSAASLKKKQLRKKRLSILGITEADNDLMSQEMFVSIAGNQFRRNGKGSFGTFLY